MKTFLLLLTILGTLSCGISSRSKAPPAIKADSSTSGLEQWSGRSDSIDARWQVKSRP